MIPLLYQKMIATLPNAKSNPEQAALYRAFAAGAAEEIKGKFPVRRERKQIFVTGMAIYYTQDLESGQFGSMGFERGMESAGEGVGQGPTRGDVAMMRGGDPRAGREMMGRGGRVTGVQGARGRVMPTMAVSESAPRGFVITISGYSPYKSINELLDPPKVQDDPNRWGLVTRLMHLDSTFDGNSPFELYKKTEKQHFELQTGEVDLTANIPAGIGVRKTIEGKGEIIIDPMTNEVISKTTEDGPGGKKISNVNDYWFVLNFKLQWKDRPGAPPAESAGTPESSPRENQPPPAGTPPPKPPKGGPKGGGEGE
jgi:hypothetical protein